MSASFPVLRAESSSIPRLAIRDWSHLLLGKLRAGQRLVTLYGTRVRDAVKLTAVLSDADGRLGVWRTRVDAHQGYHALTEEVPAFHIFEREVAEQTGLRITGHPWLKPVRSSGAPMSAYAYYPIDGKEVHEVAVGPVHAGVIEPGSFRFMCHGEQVHHLEIQLGYQHRGVDGRLLEGDPLRLAPLVETVAGDSSVAHAWAYCAAVERLSDCAISLETEVARAVALELERVAMHLAGLAGLATDIGFLQGATTYGRLRTTAINTSMVLCGSRFGRGALRPGGVGMRMPPDVQARVSANLALLRRDLPLINERFLEARTVRHRLEGVGCVSLAQAADLGLVGMAARACGVPLDLRHPSIGGAYHALPIAPVVMGSGDCWSRARLRIAEMDASLTWLAAALREYPAWGQPRLDCGPLEPGQLVVSLVEGWRGEVVHVLETDSDGRLAHYRVQDPSLRNWMGLAIAVRGNEISDFPICNKSFDLSYCGNDL